MTACSDDPTTPAPTDADDTADLGLDGPDDASDTDDFSVDVVADADLGDIDDLADAGGPFPAIARTPLADGEDGDGADDVVAALTAGEVRAGRVTSFEHGFEGVEVDCRPGDIKIYNARVAFCIAGQTPINLWTYSGGVVIDADRVGAGNERFFAAVPNNAFQLAGADEVVVVSDGANGLAAVAVRGGEEPLRLAFDLLATWLPFRGVTFETEYRLRPDVDYLEIITWVHSPNRRTSLSMGDLVIFGDTTLTFTPGYGRDHPPNETSYDLVASHAPGRSYGFYAPAGMVNLAIDLVELGAGLPATGVIEGRGTIEAGHEGVIRRYLIVGDGGTPELRAQIADIVGETVPTTGVSISATEGGSPAAGVTLFVSDSDGRPHDLVVTDSSGQASAPLPPGDWSVVPEDWVGGAVDATATTVGGDGFESVAIALPEAARLDLTIEARLDPEGDAEPSPAKVQLYGARSERFFTVDGRLEAPVRPGDYQLEVSRGEALSAHVEDVTLAAGETLTRTVVLERLWDIDGWIAGEFHQHNTRSVDSQVSEYDRLVSNIVEGVDFVVPSDHDSVTDYAPLISAHGLQDLIYAMPGLEVSPIFAHLGAMPMIYDPALPAGGAVPLAVLGQDGFADVKSFPELVTEVRDDYGAQVIQVNHPRTNQALFETVEYDPLLGPDATNPDRFTTDFDTIEVINGEDEICAVFTDWLSLVARGHSVTGVGNTDTHSLGSESGWPRNYLRSDAEGPGDITDGDILEALLAGQVTVSRGALIDFPDGPLPGDLVNVSTAETFELPIRLQTPPWSTVDTLEVWVGGTRVAQLAPEVGVDQVVTIDTTLTLDRPANDSFLVAVTWDDDRMPIVAPGERPLGFINPIFLDADGDGEWTPPGVAGEADLVRLEIPWCD